MTGEDEARAEQGLAVVVVVNEYEERGPLQYTAVVPWFTAVIHSLTSALNWDKHHRATFLVGTMQKGAVMPGQMLLPLLSWREHCKMAP